MSVKYKLIQRKDMSTDFNLLIMSVKYKLIQRKDMSTDAGPGSKLYYAQAVSAGEMTLDELCEDIAESSTVTSADVKAVLDRLGWILSKNLKAGL